MGTYGSAVVVDSPDEVRLTEAALAAQDADVYRSTLADGWTHVVTWLDAIEQVDEVSRVLSRLGTGRAAIAEDCDEFGVSGSCWPRSGVSCTPCTDGTCSMPT